MVGGEEEMKACIHCKYLVNEETVCPICGSKEFTDHFYGIVIILNEQSRLGKFLNHPVGKFALRLLGGK